MANTETIREATEKGKVEAPEAGGNGKDATGLFLPEGLKPPPGTTVAVYTFLTTEGARDDYEVVVWGPTLREEQTINKRAKGEPAAIALETIRICIRAVNGVAVNWADATKSDKVVDKFLDDIGFSGRQMLSTAYFRQFMVSEDQMSDFFGRAKIGVVG